MDDKNIKIKSVGAFVDIQYIRYKDRIDVRVDVISNFNSAVIHYSSWELTQDKEALEIYIEKCVDWGLM